MINIVNCFQYSQDQQTDRELQIKSGQLDIFQGNKNCLANSFL